MVISFAPTLLGDYVAIRAPFVTPGTNLLFLKLEIQNEKSPESATSRRRRETGLLCMGESINQRISLPQSTFS